jgi:sarcosine oxidase subunit alpha
MTTIRVNGRAVSAPDGVTVAAALLQAGQLTFRTSVSGEPRAPLCGMGICFECRVTIDGRPHIRSCQIPIREGMEIQT